MIRSEQTTGRMTVNASHYFVSRALSVIKVLWLLSPHDNTEGATQMMNLSEISLRKGELFVVRLEIGQYPIQLG